MARQETAGTIINRVAGELGLLPNADPYSTNDNAFTQLAALLNAAGQELVELFDWQVLKTAYSFTTDSTTYADGVYDFPSDFSHIVDQTGWDTGNQEPLGGPASSQGWAYLGANTVVSPLYVWYRQMDNKMKLFPSPPTDGLTISFEYVSRNWATDSGGTGIDFTTEISDVVKLEPILIQKFLKAKFLEAKGMDASAARLEFQNIFLSRTGKNEGGPILNISGGSMGQPLISTNNLPDTGYGT